MRKETIEHVLESVCSCPRKRVCVRENSMGVVGSQSILKAGTSQTH